MTYYPILITLSIAVLVWIAIEKHWKILEYIAKPAFLISLLIWIGLSVGFGGMMLWFTIGALFCLVGDMFLMLLPNRFIFGLLAFLMGHVFYVIGFNNAAPYLNLWGIFLIIMLSLYVGWLYPRLAAGLKVKNHTKLRIPVLIYAIVISTMVYSALMTWTRPGWTTVASFFVSVGGLLFYTCDSILAYNRYVKPISHGHVKYLIAYHLGQMGIILGAILFTSLK